jgi:hypothetical protein
VISTNYRFQAKMKPGSYCRIHSRQQIAMKQYKKLMKLLKVAQVVALLLLSFLMARAMKLLFLYMQGN